MPVAPEATGSGRRSQELLSDRCAYGLALARLNPVTGCPVDQGMRMLARSTEQESPTATRRKVGAGILLLTLALVIAGPFQTVLASTPARGQLGSGLPRAPRHEDGAFRNLDPDFHRASNWTRARFYLLGLASIASSARKFEPLPTATPDVRMLRENRTEATVTWVGHSTLLVQLDGVNLLTDPVWSHRLGPLSGTVGVTRFTPPGIPFDDLPPIDVVVISHDHYDHLDEPTVRRLARTFHPLFVVPLGIKAWLADRGITNVVELDWSESVKVKGVEIVCAPAQHGSGRSLIDGGRRLWASWAVIGSQRFYFGGDSGYASHFELIGRLLGPFDLAALPIGSYTPRAIARTVHMSPEEALLAARDLRAQYFIGIHWGTYKLAREPYGEPPRRIAAEIARLKLDPKTIWLPEPGLTLDW
jgi:N-acyl-phosphatidylethanolamine-hydrolysing phospholipase D